MASWLGKATKGKLKKVRNNGKTRRIDWQRTKSCIINQLEHTLTPVHYRECFDMCVAYGHSCCYSENTDPAEKLRYSISRTRNGDLSLVNGGYYALRSWFTNKKQSSFLMPQAVIIDFNEDVKNKAMYELKQRLPYMYDWQNDRGTTGRKIKREEGFLVEYHVAEYFKTRFNDYYLEPDNHRKWNEPCDHDFKLITQNYKIMVDVKNSTLYNKTDKAAFVRKIEPRHVYIFASIGRSKNIYMHGFLAGRDIPKITGKQAKAVVSYKSLRSPKELICFLNCETVGINFLDVVNSITL